MASMTAQDTDCAAAQCLDCGAVWAGCDSVGTAKLDATRCYWCGGALGPWSGDVPDDAVSIPGQTTRFAKWHPCLRALPRWPTHMSRAELLRLEAEFFA
jgi:hypothetical protein